MEAKLAAYRAKKMAEKKKEEHRQKLWSWITLEGKKSVQKRHIMNITVLLY
jgi:hypothetical protein